jgi:hypothetical protein
MAAVCMIAWSWVCTIPSIDYVWRAVYIWIGLLVFMSFISHVLRHVYWNEIYTKPKGYPKYSQP